MRHQADSAVEVIVAKRIKDLVEEHPNMLGCASRPNIVVDFDSVWIDVNRRVPFGTYIDKIKLVLRQFQREKTREAGHATRSLVWGIEFRIAPPITLVVLAISESPSIVLASWRNRGVVQESASVVHRFQGTDREQRLLPGALPQASWTPSILGLSVGRSAEI